MATPDVQRPYDHNSHYRGPYNYNNNNLTNYSDFSGSRSYETAIRGPSLSSRTPVHWDQPRPWSDTREQQGSQGKGLMSDRDRPNQQAPLGSSTRDGSQAVSRAPSTSPPAGYSALRAAYGTRNVTSPTGQRPPPAAGHSVELPPLHQTHHLHGGTFSPSATRIAGVSSILNPPQAEESYASRRRKASHLESPASSTQSIPPILAGPQTSQAAATYPIPSPGIPGQPRRILTPRSPSLHRAASLGQLNQPVGTINAQRAPFPASPRSRTYAIEPGTGNAPPLPTPPALARSTYGFPAPTPSSEAARRASGGVARARGLSSSASPSTSYSSYSQAERASPRAQYASLSMTGGPSAYSTGGEGASGPERQRPMGIPISSSGGQNVYQMMTLETTSGTVQLPVDVQAASRVADEKRKRNAGASARFRQRRKEKEKEASTTIGKLEQQVKELGEDADFYRRERDFFAGILTQVPGYERHFPRPASPRQRRSSLVPGETLGFPPGQEQMMRSPEEGRNVRRRTSTFSLPPPPPPHLPAPSVPMHSTPAYAPQGYSTPLAPQPSLAQQQIAPGLPPSPNMRGSLSTPGQQQQQQQQLPPVLQTLPQTGPWNPYASERRPTGPLNPPRDGR